MKEFQDGRRGQAIKLLTGKDIIEVEDLKEPVTKFLNGNIDESELKSELTLFIKHYEK